MKKPIELEPILVMWRQGSDGLRLKILILSGFGTGFSPLAPGTAGTLFAWGTTAVVEVSGWLLLILGIFLSLLGVMLLGYPEFTEFAARDSPWIVLDEVAAFLILYGFVSPRAFGEEAFLFLLFRALDVLKPPPIRYWEGRFPGPWGVMGDDLIAALWGMVIILGVRACGYLL